MILSLYLRLLQRGSISGLWHRYSKLCRKQGISKPYFTLSFDCDTYRDIEVVEGVHSRLSDMGILPVYAVPGAFLKRGESVYRRIYEQGAEFINHGGREHTYFDEIKGREASCFFYDQQPLALIEEDIISGHNTIKEIFGSAAIGYRTPHFGTFQKPKQLAFLYSILKRYNYVFSSSTVPLFGFKHGPCSRRGDILELPVTGIPSEPFNILDSWGFFASPERTKKNKDYLVECERFSNILKGRPLYINIYADPSHIYKEEYFFRAMQLLVKQCESVTYKQFIGKML